MSAFRLSLTVVLAFGALGTLGTGRLPGARPPSLAGGEMAAPDSATPRFRLREGEPAPFLLAREGFPTPRVEGSLSFDREALRISAVVHDRHFHDGQRAWRAGDGFTVNFVIPGPDDVGDGADFYAFGFAREAGKPVGVLINDAGRWRLATRPELAPRVEIDTAAGTARYAIDLPWTSLPRFSPWFDARAGLNLVYVSRNDDGSRTILKLVDDPDYDTERTNRRRFVTLFLEPGPASGLRAGGVLARRLLDRPDAEAALSIWSPECRDGDVVFDLLAPGRPEPVASVRRRLPLESGRNRVDLRLALPAGVFGPLHARITVDGTRVLDADVVRRHPASLEAALRVARRLSASPRHARDVAAARSLELQVAEAEAFAASLRPREDPLPALERVDSVEAFARAAEAGRAYSEPGFAPATFRSSLDGTLQPYSLVLPEAFDPAAPHDLVLALHGSGVDEVAFVKKYGRDLAAARTIVCGPRGRGLSDWYLGPSERDTLDAVRAAREMFRIRRVVALGFSMGGYGVWRLVYGSPREFAGAVVLSGSPFPLLFDDPAHDLRRRTFPGDIPPLLVIHGTADRAVPIGPTDELVSALRLQGLDVSYFRLDGAAHGDYDAASVVVPWLRERLGASP